MAGQRGRHRPRDAQPRRPPRAGALLRLGARRPAGVHRCAEPAHRRPRAAAAGGSAAARLLLRHHGAGVRHPRGRTHHRPRRARGPQRRRHRGRLHHRRRSATTWSATARRRRPATPATSATRCRCPTARCVAVRTTSPYADRAAQRPAVVALRFPPRPLVSGTPDWTPGARLIPNGISKSISYWDNQSYRQLSYSGPLWELDPVEVRARPRPPRHQQSAAGDRDADPARRARRRRGDRSPARLPRRAQPGADRQPQRHPPRRPAAGLQPARSPAARRRPSPRARRRSRSPTCSSSRATSSAATRSSTRAGGRSRSCCTTACCRRSAARRRAACGWPRTAASRRWCRPAARSPGSSPTADGTPVVRERYWVTFAAGEMRVCTNCHGVNTHRRRARPAGADQPAAGAARAGQLVAGDLRRRRADADTVDAPRPRARPRRPPLAPRRRRPPPRRWSAGRCATTARTARCPTCCCPAAPRAIQAAPSRSAPRWARTWCWRRAGAAESTVP